MPVSPQYGTRSLRSLFGHWQSLFDNFLDAVLYFPCEKLQWYIKIKSRNNLCIFIRAFWQLAMIRLLFLFLFGLCIFFANLPIVIPCTNMDIR
jgi:hypothetical protein